MSNDFRDLNMQLFVTYIIVLFVTAVKARFSDFYFFIAYPIKGDLIRQRIWSTVWGTESAGGGGGRARSAVTPASEEITGVDILQAMASKPWGSCPKPTRIAAIDFGTGFCSLAFTLAENAKIVSIPLSSLDSARVPTAILLEKKPDEFNLQVVKFGSQAQDLISKMTNEDLEKHLYFECFKMDLFHEAVSIMVLVLILCYALYNVELHCQLINVAGRHV